MSSVIPLITISNYLFQAYGGGAFGPAANGPASGPGGGGGTTVEGATYPPDSPYFPFGTRGVPPPSVGTPTSASNPATPTGNTARLPNSGELYIFFFILSFYFYVYGKLLFFTAFNRDRLFLNKLNFIYYKKITFLNVQCNFLN